jgi:uncharacterized repeat protein (TIGR01451 family)
MGHRRQTGEFYVPGSLATDITTFRSDGTTPTSAIVGVGGALMYKITVTNTSYLFEDNTGVILTDPLPPEVFAIIKPPTGEPIVTDHGTCTMATAPGSLPPVTVTCALGSLAPGETATVYFTASIRVRHPSGRPQPPESFVNTVHVKSDQQSLTSTSVKTLVTLSELTDADIEAFFDAVRGCVSLVLPRERYLGLAWEVLGRDLPAGQPNPYIEWFARAFQFQ